VRTKFQLAVNLKAAKEIGPIISGIMIDHASELSG
jgi:hypothetical protein